jgi:hypothetical protein
MFEAQLCPFNKLRPQSLKMINLNLFWYFQLNLSA